MAIQSATAESEAEATSAPPATAGLEPAPCTQRPIPSIARPEETERLRERLITLQHRARDLFKSSWLRLSGTAPLILLADRALSLIKRVQTSIERRDSLTSVPEANGAEISDSPTLEGWLQDTDDALSEIERQYSWLEVTCKLADESKEIFARLLKEQRVSYADLLPLATSIFDSITGIDAPAKLFPVPGLQAASIYHGRQPCVRPSVYTIGVSTARWAAWALVSRQGWRTDVADVVLGALFQEVGWLALQPYVAESNRRGPRRAEWLARQHPQVGATVLSSVVRVPLVLPSMVAMHHERLDGSGYPRRISGSGLSRMGRMVASVSRTFELYEELSSEGQAGGLESHMQRMAAGLRHEARCGWWDEDAVRQLVAAIPAPVTHAAESELETSKLPPVVLGERTLELHGQQTKPPEGHSQGTSRQDAEPAQGHGIRPAHFA